MQSVITDLSRFMQFSEDESLAFEKILRLKTVKKNEHILVEGDVCNFGIFIAEVVFDIIIWLTE